MDNLLTEINDYYHSHGHYPKVKTSRDFYKKYYQEFYDKYYWQIQHELTEISIDETVDQWELE